MITITKELSITAGEAPFTYSWINNSSCITIPQSTGISTDGLISSQINFYDENCLNAADLQILITDSKGCVATFDIAVESPCSGLTVTPIQYEGDFSFSILAAGGSPAYKYVWTYDSTYFDTLPSSSNKLTLVPTAPLNNEVSTTVKCVVTDSKGCTKTKVYTLNFCAPVAQPKYVALVCSATTNQAHKNHVILDVTTCANSTILWDTLVFNGIPSGITIQTDNHPNEPNAIDITANLNLITPGTYTGYYTVFNSYNTSTTTELVIYITDCSTPAGIYGTNYAVSLPCPSTAGATVAINLEDYVYSSYPINWSSFAFNPLSGQSSGSQFALTGVLGNATVSLGHVLTYTLTASTALTEIIQWAVCNTNGDCVANITFTILSNCPTPPVAVNNTFCAACNQATPYLNILSNDTGSFDPSTVTIVTPTTHGSVLISPTGTISYTADANYSGADSFTYTITNPITGQTSNAATVTFNVVCAGTDAIYTACN